ELAPRTRRKRLLVVRVWVRWMTAEGHIPKDVTVGLRLPREPRTTPRGQPADKVQAVLAHAPTARLTLMVLLMVQEGLRRGEVARIRTEDIDFNERILFV